MQQLVFFSPFEQPQQALEILKMHFIECIDDQGLVTCPETSPKGHMSTAVSLCETG